MNLAKIKTWTGVGLLALALCFMGFNALVIRAANPYDDDTLSLEQVMSEYHRHMNDSFNANIKKMLTESQKNPNDPNGMPPTGNEPEKFCGDKPENYSTYCVAVRLLGDPADEKQKGYLNYKKALETRRNQIFDTAAEKDAYDAFIKAVVRDGQQQSEKAQAVYQTQKLLGIRDRTAAIDREILAAKEALDKTLATYDQLRVTFPMHLKYREIFDNLVEYRDKLVELRQQTDQFPGKFVDVTTMKCT